MLLWSGKNITVNRTNTYWDIYFDISGILTGVFVLGFVHLPISTFSGDPNDFKLVNAPLAPVYLRLLDLSEAWATNSATQPDREIFAFAKEKT